MQSKRRKICHLQTAIDAIEGGIIDNPKLEKRFINPYKGFGVFAKIDLCPGEFVAEYVGQILPEKEGEKRLKKLGPSYLYFFDHEKKTYCIDGEVGGGIASYINDSCNSPSCRTLKLTTSDGKPHIAIFVRQEKGIPAGEELLYNYGTNSDKMYWRKGQDNPTPYEGPVVEERPPTPPSAQVLEERPPTTSASVLEERPPTPPPALVLEERSLTPPSALVVEERPPTPPSAPVIGDAINNEVIDVVPSTSKGPVVEERPPTPPSAQVLEERPPTPSASVLEERPPTPPPAPVLEERSLTPPSALVVEERPPTPPSAPVIGDAINNEVIDVVPSTSKGSAFTMFDVYGNPIRVLSRDCVVTDVQIHDRASSFVENSHMDKDVNPLASRVSSLEKELCTVKNTVRRIDTNQAGILCTMQLMLQRYGETNKMLQDYVMGKTPTIQKYSGQKDDFENGACSTDPDSVFDFNEFGPGQEIEEPSTLTIEDVITLPAVIQLPGTNDLSTNNLTTTEGDHDSCARTSSKLTFFAEEVSSPSSCKSSDGMKRKKTTPQGRRPDDFENGACSTDPDSVFDFNEFGPGQEIEEPSTLTREDVITLPAVIQLPGTNDLSTNNLTTSEGDHDSCARTNSKLTFFAEEDSMELGLDLEERAAANVFDTDCEEQPLQETEEQMDEGCYRRPRRPCFFCIERRTIGYRNLTRHFKTMHKDNEEVKNIMQLPPKEQNFQFALLRKNGIQKFNKKTYSSGTTLMRERNQGTRSSSELGSCSKCKGIFLKRTISHHFKNCKLQFSASEKTTPVNDYCQQVSLKYLYENKKTQFHSEVMSSLSNDSISQFIKDNEMIQKIGESYFNSKFSKSSKIKTYIAVARQEMRTIAQLFLEFRERLTKCIGVPIESIKLEEMFSRDSRNILGVPPGINLKILKETIKSTSEKGSSARSKIYWSLKRAAKVLAGIYTQVCLDKEANDLKFWEVAFSSTDKEIFSDSIKSSSFVRSRKLRKPGLLPNCNDVLLIKKYILTELKKYDFSFPLTVNYVKLRALLLTRLTFLNGRRGGEAARLTLHAFKEAKNDEWINKKLEKELTEDDNKLLEKYKLTYVEGKGSERMVPLLISPECIHGIDLLCDEEIRSGSNVHPSNPFVFAPTGMKKYNVCGTTDIHNVMKLVPQLSENVTATRMRHYVSTYASKKSKNTAKGEHNNQHLEYIAMHLGHDKEINQHVYQSPYGIEEVLCVGATLDHIDDANKNDSSKSESTPPESTPSQSTPMVFTPSEPIIPLVPTSGFTPASTASNQNSEFDDCKRTPKSTSNKRAYWNYREESLVEARFGQDVLKNQCRNPSKSEIYEFMRQNPKVKPEYTPRSRYIKIRTKVINMKKDNKFRIIEQASSNDITSDEDFTPIDH